jgi:hypothetical protein
MDENKTLLQTLTKPLFVGVVGIVISKFVFGEEGDLIIFGQNIPGWIGVGGSLVATTLLTESLGNYVLPYIPTNYRYASTEKMIVEPAINAACLYALFSFGVTAESSAPNYMFPLILGSLSTIGGEYAYNTFSSVLMKNNIMDA